MNKLNLLIIISFFISCGKKIEKKDENGNLMKLYYLNSKGNLNGTYKKFDENGKISVIHNYENGKLIDSSVFFKNGIIDEIIYRKNSDTTFVKIFSNGKIYASGNSYNKNKLGKWNFYKENKPSKTIEFINLCGKQYTNQGWDYLNKEKSNFYEIKGLKSMYKRNENIFAQIDYHSLWKDESFSIFKFSPYAKNDFCNIDLNKLDIIKSENHKFILKVNFSKSGKKILRGYINEFKFVKEYNKKFTLERRMYIEIPIDIK